MISGAHAVIFSRDANADREFLRDALHLDAVDAGGGWLIFGLPPSELAVHPDDVGERHELYLLCDDIEVLVASLDKKGVQCAPLEEPMWGRLTYVTMPGGGRLGIYEPKHARPESKR